jgi:glycosyltransferase involved in cell wall biosynthesis
MIDIIVPVYNEGKNIETLLKRVGETVKAPKNVIVVYDFDEDDTVPILFKIKDSFAFGIVLVRNTLGRGVLNAIKTGFIMSKADAVLLVMADLSDSLEIVDTMYERLSQGYDIVCGSRYMRGGRQTGGPLLKKTLSRMAGISLHYLTGIPTHDVTNSFKMYSRKLLQSIEVKSDGGFELGIELTVKAYVQGYKITEVASAWNDRVCGTSNFKMWQWLPKYLRWYLYGITHSWFSVLTKGEC